MLLNPTIRKCLDNMDLCMSHPRMTKLQGYSILASEQVYAYWWADLWLHGGWQVAWLFTAASDAKALVVVV